MADVVEFLLTARDQASAVFERLRQNASRTADQVRHKLNEIRLAPATFGVIPGTQIPVPPAIGEAIDRLKGRFASMGAAASRAWTLAVSAASAAGVSIGLTAAGVVTWLVKVNTEYQRLQAQLRTFEGSQGA